jgi:voltage-gated potassium channel
MGILALLVIPVLVMEDRATTPELRQAATVLNWIIWIAFVAEFTVKWAADRTLAFLRKAWFDFLLIVLTPPFGVPEMMQGIRSLRVLRLLRLVRAFGVAGMGLRLVHRHFGKQKFHYVLVLACATVVLGAVGVFALEAGENKGIQHFGDALWWAMTTVTTVGYADITPITPEGRMIAVVLMVTGVGVIGVFTATVASFFFEDQKTEPSELAAMAGRLDAMDKKIDLLLGELKARNRVP